MNKEKLKQELLIMRTLQIKPNYSELARLYKCDRRAVKKYNTEFIENNQKRNRKSKLDSIKEEIKEKLSLPGATIVGTYQYFCEKFSIGTYSTFLQIY